MVDQHRGARFRLPIGVAIPSRASSGLSYWSSSYRTTSRRAGYPGSSPTRSEALNEVPEPESALDRRVPPRASTRSRRPTRPEPPLGSALPMPSSRTDSRNLPSSKVSKMVIRDAWECTRNQAPRSTNGRSGRSGGSPARRRRWRLRRARPSGHAGGGRKRCGTRRLVAAESLEKRLRNSLDTARSGRKCQSRRADSNRGPLHYE